MSLLRLSIRGGKDRELEADRSSLSSIPKLTVGAGPCRKAIETLPSFRAVSSIYS